MLRGEQTVQVAVVPKGEMGRIEMVTAKGKLSQPHATVGRMGVVLGRELRRTGVVEGLVLGAQQSVASVLTVVYSFKLMLSGTVEAEPTGPIGIMAVAIAKHVVQAHGGSIEAERNRPHGMVFTFRLPVAGPPEFVNETPGVTPAPAIAN